MNFTALLIRFVTTCRKRAASPTKVHGTESSMEYVKTRDLAFALMPCISKLKSMQFSKTKGATSRVSLSASSLEKSSTSLTIESSDLPARVTMSMSST